MDTETTADRACSCAEHVNLHSGHCCLREMSADADTIPCHDADFRARAGWTQ